MQALQIKPITSNPAITSSDTVTAACAKTNTLWVLLPVRAADDRAPPVRSANCRGNGCFIYLKTGANAKQNNPFASWETFMMTVLRFAAFIAFGAATAGCATVALAMSTCAT